MQLSAAAMRILFAFLALLVAAVPAHAQVEVRSKSSATHSYTEKYLQQSEHFHAALSGKNSH